MSHKKAQAKKELKRESSFWDTELTEEEASLVSDIAQTAIGAAAVFLPFSPPTVKAAGGALIADVASRRLF